MPEIRSQPTFMAPSYRTIGVQEIDGNPLAAHLPLAPENDEEAFLSLGVRPEFDILHRQLPRAVRRLLIKRLKRFFVPVHPMHIPALNSICTTVHDGYLARNPMTPFGQRILYGQSVDLKIKPEITMVAGYSGMGKSTLIDRTLAYLGGQVWRHTHFKGHPFSETQVVWMRRNVPHQCTVKALCSTFGDYIDSVLGMKLYGGAFERLSRADGPRILTEIRRIITDHHVGMLVLDEFQNLSLMGVGAKTIIALLVNLRDELGLPIVVVGTYKALRLMKSDLSTARRLAEGGYFDLNRPVSPDDEHWVSLCSAAWEYQWVRDPIEFSDSICHALYEVSQGITGIMLTTLATAQIAAIEDGGERVDETLIRRVFQERMEPLHPAVRVLQSRNPKLLDQFDDLYKNAWPTADDRVVGDDRPGGVLSADADPSMAPEYSPSIDGAAPIERGAGNAAARGKVASKPTPVLSEEKVRELVMAHSISDIAALLDKP